MQSTYCLIICTVCWLFSSYYSQLARARTYALRRVESNQSQFSVCWERSNLWGDVVWARVGVCGTLSNGLDSSSPFYRVLCLLGIRISADQLSLHITNHTHLDSGSSKSGFFYEGVCFAPPSDFFQQLVVYACLSFRSIPMYHYSF